MVKFVVIVNLNLDCFWPYFCHFSLKINRINILKVFTQISLK